MELLLGTLGHRGGEFTSLLHLYADGIPYTAVMDPADAVAKAATMPGNADCYFSVNPVKGPARERAGRGTAEDNTRLAALYGDIDLKEGACPTLDIAKAIVAELSTIVGTRPSAIVHSGGGIHPYWPISDGDDPAVARPLLRRWGRLVAAVAGRHGVKLDGVYDISRMLRLPGTNNMKTGQPRPVTAECAPGGPLTIAEVAERLDEWGIPEIDDDSADSGEVLAAPAEWQWAEKTCAYVATIIAGIPTDKPKKGRNPWLLSQKVRLACAHRLACITEADYTAAVAALEARFTEVAASPKWGTPRKPKKFEFRDTTNCAINKASRKTDEQARQELGNHTHHDAEPSVTEVGPEDLGGDTAAETTTWEAFDLEPWLDGSNVSPQPEVGIRRTDGQQLLYPGREHVVFGETECGKSWLALECAALEIRMGRDVVYIHYEEGDPASTIERLQLLSVHPNDIARHLRFVAPARPVQGAWLTPLLDPPPALVIHDGVNEAMSLHGDDTNQTDGAATFRRNIIKPFLAAGVTSLACDHVVKNSDSRGRYAIGSVHKVNAIDGAALLMENIEPFGRGLRGASSVYITKDRPGQLRAHGRPVTGVPGKTLIGVLAVDASPEAGEDFLTFHPPREKDADETEAAGPSLADEVYRALLAQPEHAVESGRQLKAALRQGGVKFTNAAAGDAVEDLLLARRIVKVPGANKAVGYRAVLKDSGDPSDSPGQGAPTGDPFGDPPIESGSPEHSVIRDPRITADHCGSLEAGEAEVSPLAGAAQL
jgi:hypothetical protein